MKEKSEKVTRRIMARIAAVIAGGVAMSKPEIRVPHLFSRPRKIPFRDDFRFLTPRLLCDTTTVRMDVEIPEKLETGEPLSVEQLLEFFPQLGESEPEIDPKTKEPKKDPKTG